MIKHGVDLDAAANGVFLPTLIGTFVGDEVLHVGSHGADYMKYINETLTAVDKAGGSQQDIINVINQVRGKLLDGTLP